MNKFFLLLFLSVANINPVLSQSGLLESVKKNPGDAIKMCNNCLLYTSDAADEEDSVDLGGRRIIKKIF